MTGDLPRLRDLHGATAALWGGPGARVEPGRWVALSGAGSVDFNVVVCHGASDGESIPRALEEVAAVGAPALVMVAGPALAEVQSLVRASWVCVGAAAFMHLGLSDFEPPPAAAQVRRLTQQEVARAQVLAGEVFDLGVDAARTALPAAAADVPGRSIWGSFAPDGTLACCLATVVEQDVVAVWSMATHPAHQRQGLAAGLLRTALAAAREDGAEQCLLTSSTAGEPFYRALGFIELERWQLWSRPRWVMGRV